MLVKNCKILCKKKGCPAKQQNKEETTNLERCNNNKASM